MRIEHVPTPPNTPTREHEELAFYIIDWLCRRNEAELGDAILEMSVAEYRLMHDQLAYILMHGGHPPNWEPRPAAIRDPATDYGVAVVGSYEYEMEICTCGHARINHGKTCKAPRCRCEDFTRKFAPSPALDPLVDRLTAILALPADTEHATIIEQIRNLVLPDRKAAREREIACEAWGEAHAEYVGVAQAGVTDAFERWWRGRS